MLHVIEDAQVETGRRLRLRFSDGRSGVVDLGELLERGGVFASLKDEVTFAQVRVSGHGRWLEWPGDIDLCADSLYDAIDN